MLFPLPAWDQSDEFGIVHTTPPPELVIPAKYDPLFFRGDFSGVTLQGTYTPAGGGWVMTSGPWNGLYIPFLVGANSTPPTMIMTPMLPLYWALGYRKLVDACLTEHAWRNYSHLTWDQHPWNLEENGMAFSIKQAIQWANIVKSWGFYNVMWSGEPFDASNPMWNQLANAKAMDLAIVGEEVDSKVTSEEYDAILRSLILGGPLDGIPTCAHFTAGAKGGYPLGFPRDTFITNWADFDGKLHLAHQANQNFSAGEQGADLVYTRRRVNLGGEGGDGRPAPNSRVILFEIEASNELPGKVNEEYGCLRSLESLYCPADPGMRMFAGCGDGLRYPDGSAV